MSVHVICPSLRCRKILALGDDVRGTTVTCRYCSLEFRVPHIRKAQPAIDDVVAGQAVSASSSEAGPPDSQVLPGAIRARKLQ